MIVALNRLIVNYIFKPHLGKRFVVIVGDHVSKEIVNSGCYERPLIKFLMKQKNLFSTNNSGIFIDVGANIGNHSIMLSEYFDKVVAVEPNTFCAKCIELTAELNSLNNIEVKRIGLGVKSSKMYLAVPTDDFSSGHVIDKKDINVREELKEIDVMTLDDLGKQVEGGISFIKIDAEGMEKDIIDSGKHFFKISQPLVAFEAHGKDKYSEVQSSLSKHGYKYFYKLTQSRRMFKNRILNVIMFLFFPDYVKVSKVTKPMNVNYQMVLASTQELDLR
jgi:FkbM family methyltransferase